MKLKIKKYINEEINHLWCKVKIINEKSDLALQEAEKKLNFRLEGMNEFRSQLTEQAKTFITKKDLELINQDIKYLQKIINIGVGIWLLLQCIIVAILLLVFK